MQKDLYRSPSIVSILLMTWPLPLPLGRLTWYVYATDSSTVKCYLIHRVPVTTNEIMYGKCLSSVWHKIQSIEVYFIYNCYYCYCYYFCYHYQSSLETGEPFHLENSNYFFFISGIFTSNYLVNYFSFLNFYYLSIAPLTLFFRSLIQALLILTYFFCFTKRVIHLNFEVQHDLSFFQFIWKYSFKIRYRKACLFLCVCIGLRR